MFVQKTQHEEQPWKIKLIATMLPKKKKIETGPLR